MRILHLPEEDMIEVLLRTLEADHLTHVHVTDTELLEALLRLRSSPSLTLLIDVILDSYGHSVVRV